jgi:hypothetical protein
MAYLSMMSIAFDNQNFTNGGVITLSTLMNQNFTNGGVIILSTLMNVLNTC